MHTHEMISFCVHGNRHTYGTHEEHYPYALLFHTNSKLILHLHMGLEMRATQITSMSLLADLELLLLAPELLMLLDMFLVLQLLLILLLLLFLDLLLLSIFIYIYYMKALMLMVLLMVLLVDKLGGGGYATLIGD